MVCARRILGVSHAATPDVVKAAFRSLAKRWHPDFHQGNEASAAEQFKRVRNAYDEILLASSSPTPTNTDAQPPPQQHTQDAWWRRTNAPQANRHRVTTMRALLTRHAAEARRLAAHAAAAHDALTDELIVVREGYGVHVQFEASLRCSLTKRRLLMTLHEQLTLHADMRTALGGRTTFFTTAEPGAAFNAMLVVHARARAESAEADGTGPPLPIWLSLQDTPSGWQHAASSAVRTMARHTTLVQTVTPDGFLRLTPVSRPLEHASEEDQQATATQRAERLADWRGLEAEAARVLGVRSLAPETALLRVDRGYVPLLTALASPALAKALRVEGGWADGGRASAWSAVIVPRLSLRALCKPSLQPRLMKLRLPLGCDEPGDDGGPLAPGASSAAPSTLLATMPPLLNHEGVLTIADTQAARELLRECTEALGLRALRTEEMLSPRQVIRAADAMLRKGDEWRALGSEGCVLSIGEQGFAMASDGVLRIQWDAV